MWKSVSSSPLIQSPFYVPSVLLIFLRRRPHSQSNEATSKLEAWICRVHQYIAIILRTGVSLLKSVSITGVSLLVSVSVTDVSLLVSVSVTGACRCSCQCLSLVCHCSCQCLSLMCHCLCQCLSQMCHHSCHWCVTAYVCPWYVTVHYSVSVTSVSHEHDMCLENITRKEE